MFQFDNIRIAELVIIVAIVMLVLYVFHRLNLFKSE